MQAALAFLVGFVTIAASVSRQINFVHLSSDLPFNLFDTYMAIFIQAISTRVNPESFDGSRFPVFLKPHQ